MGTIIYDEFEWDEDKARSNFSKHGVDFREALEALSDPLSMVFIDEDSHPGELRYGAVGRSRRGRVLVVISTDRPNRCRIISARVATKREQARYESTE